MDGGFSNVENYEALPDSWLYDSCIGYLCPPCSEVFEESMSNFFFGRDGVPEPWRTKNDPTCEANGVTLYRINNTEVKESEDLC